LCEKDQQGGNDPPDRHLDRRRTPFGFVGRAHIGSSIDHADMTRQLWP
jgi:hypothetical protein